MGTAATTWVLWPAADTDCCLMVGFAGQRDGDNMGAVVQQLLLLVGCSEQARQGGVGVSVVRRSCVCVCASQGRLAAGDRGGKREGGGALSPWQCMPVGRGARTH